jgi:hypothetical protein
MMAVVKRNKQAKPDSELLTANRVDDFLPWYCNLPADHAASQRYDAIIDQIATALKTSLSGRLATR